MRFLRITSVLLLFLGAADRTRADDAASPEALQAANELFSILSPDLTKQLTAQMNNLIWPMLEQRAHAEKIDDATIADLRKEFERVQLNILGSIMKDAPPIYARHFTVDELKQLVAFYRSPVGVKAMQQLPQVMDEFVAAMTPRLQTVQQQAMDSFNEVLRRHGYPK